MRKKSAHEHHRTTPRGGARGWRVCTVVLGVVMIVQVQCLWYMTHNRDKVLLEGIDIDQTLVVAEHELREGGWGSVLTVWAMRDQKITPAQADEVSRLYFAHIDSLQRSFNVWHLTWAVANMYRLGGAEVKAALQEAFNDASKRAADLSSVADRHVNGDKIYMGDAHIGGRHYARKHLVVPGNDRYLQSARSYLQQQENEQ